MATYTWYLPALSLAPVVDPTPPDTVGVDGCWIGVSSAFELRLRTPLPTYGLESLRQRFMFFVTNSHEPVKSARVVLQMAFETEMKATLVKLIDLPADVMRSNVCQRRGFIPIDRDMAAMRFLVEPALNELAAVPNVPVEYVDLIRRYAISDYPRYRVCAIADALCLAAVVLTS